MAELRKGHGFRVRCLLDDGTSAHIAIDMQGALDLGTLALVTKTFRRCGCGGELFMLGADAPEPSETNAARKAHDESAASLVTQHCVRVKWGHSDDALRVLFADGAERTNRQIAEALKVSGDAVSQLLRRSTVVERVKHGVWRLRAQGGEGPALSGGDDTKVSRNNNTVCCESGCPNLAAGTRWRVGGWQPCCAACGGETFTPWPGATVTGGRRG